MTHCQPRQLNIDCHEQCKETHSKVLCASSGFGLDLHWFGDILPVRARDMWVRLRQPCMHGIILFITITQVMEEYKRETQLHASCKG